MKAILRSMSLSRPAACACLVVFCLLLGSGAAAHAQVNTATLLGQLTDSPARPCRARRCWRAT